MSICVQPPETGDKAVTAPADDVQVLETALEWLQSGQAVALVTVVRTWGSSPRPPGSQLAVNSAGQFSGSVSGGCVEETLVARYRNGEIAGPEPTWIDFGVDRQEAARMGLPCGGRLELLVEHLEDPEALAPLLESLRRGGLMTRRVGLPGGKVSLEEGEGEPDFSLTEKEVAKTYGPAWKLLLIGDGLIARHLASMARQLDYRVIVCDPRESFANSHPLHDVEHTNAMPDDAVDALSNATRAAIVTLAHDPRQDDLGLSAAMESQAFYIGALGSQRSAESRRKRLASLGYSNEQLARIHGPAGLYIGSKRPAEIALSILAEITALRNGVSQSAETAQ